MITNNRKNEQHNPTEESPAANSGYIQAGL